MAAATTEANLDTSGWTERIDRALGQFAASELPPTLKLPALPHAVASFQQKASDPDVAIKDLARIIETDTGLTLELLRHVNSSFNGLRHRASSVQQAITLLGIRQSKTFVVTTGIQAAVQARKSKLINQSCFWNASLQKALFAKVVAGLIGADADTAFAGALLQDFLLPVLTNDLFDKYVAFVGQRAAQQQLLPEYEQQQFGWDHAIAGASLARRWHLPDELVACVLYHHLGLRALAEPELKRTSVAAVALSALLPDQLRQDFRGLEQLIFLQGKWSKFDLKTLTEQVDELHGEMGLGVRNDFPLSRRCKPAFADSAERFDDGSVNRTALAG
ncbi:HDOD domain-containing protein [Stratiformator vulcanicus]|uniref:HDOD domain protein n=1 Tax=Stratiformator vulcanicus TaxID=2527980 RepID=A0A517QZW3_9PLAN|nr:HDOD domain-containing protein [Stratiformator vulcanicus]QDT37100.1 HDOD domain protein [Stratiformator vulcanicus]